MPQNLSTHADAFFIVYDDPLVDCVCLQHGFEAWESSPCSFVGYYPRAHVTKQTSSSSSVKLHHAWNCACFTNTFSITLTKGSFMHESCFNHYWDMNDETQSLVRECVDSKRNCEDVAMALLIAS